MPQEAADYGLFEAPKPDGLFEPTCMPTKAFANLPAVLMGGDWNKKAFVWHIDPSIKCSGSPPPD